MNNKFCISKNDLIRLYETRQRNKIQELVEKFTSKLSQEEMVKQMKDETGVMGKDFKQEIKTFSNKTENVEIQAAFDLSDFYFGENVNTQICFEMKPAFRKKQVKTYEELLQNIESQSHVDCVVENGQREHYFQIKRYPENYLEFTNEKLIEFLSKVFRDYGDMGETTLVVVLQPRPFEGKGIKFNNLNEELLKIKELITFSEVALIFNNNNKEIIYLRIFPDYVQSKKVF